MALNRTKSETPPEIIIISGSNGAGKTRLADCMPAPYFINVENTGALTNGVQHFPTNCPSLEAFKTAIDEFATETHDFKTLVIDSINALETLVIQDIRRRNGGETNLAKCDGGFNGGYNSLYSIMNGIALRLCEVREKLKCYVVIIIHSRPRDVELPGMSVFQQWQPNLTITKQYDLADIFKRESDMWLHVWSKYNVVDDANDDAKIRRQLAIGGAVKRMIGVEQTPTFYAKNRHGWTGSIDFEQNAASFIRKMKESRQPKVDVPPSQQGV